jgi:hypothetical protein
MQNPILLLKIPMSTRESFPENYRQFGHALSKRFASPALDRQECLQTQNFLLWV